MDSSEVSLMSQTLVEKFTIFYGDSNYESKQEADIVIQEIIKSPLFSDCFLFRILFFCDYRFILHQQVSPSVLFGVFTCAKNLIGTSDGQHFSDLYSIRKD